MLIFYSVTAGLSGLFLFTIPDRWGRVKSMKIFGGISLIAQFIIILIPNLYARQFGYALMGLCQLKNGVSYVWMFENVESPHKSTVCGLMNMFDTVSLAVVAIYFMYEPNWFYLEFSMSCLCAVSYIILMTVMPESAKWCLIKGNMEGALASFDRIAKINGSKARIPRDALFAEFIIAKNFELEVNQTNNQTVSAANESHNDVTMANRSVVDEMLDLPVKATSIHKLKPGRDPALSRKGKYWMSQRVVFFVLISVYTITYFESWLVIFGTSQLPGPKLRQAVIFGIAEASSCLTSGLIVRSMKDSTATVMFCITGSIATLAFYLTGGAETGLLGTVLLFIETFSIGAIVSLTYVLVELRVPPDAFAPTTVLCVTAALMCSSFAQFLACAPGIIPTAIIVGLFFVMGAMTSVLPPGGYFLHSADD